MAIKNLWVDENSLLFHTINRDKESYAADLKNKEDLDSVKKLIRHADIIIHNFRPGIMEKIGLDYDSVQQINSKIIYGEISGYGKTGPWKDKPGQDLLLQSMTGLAFTSGNHDENPTPFGLAMADNLCGAQLVQGILAALIRRHKTGMGASIEVSLFESLIDFQFELLTTYFCSGQQPRRSNIHNGHPLLGAPYGIFQTADSFLALTMIDLQVLASIFHSERLQDFTQKDAFEKRDEIKTVLSKVLIAEKTSFWLQQLHEKDLWAMEVLNWKQMSAHEAYQCLQMEQSLKTDGSLKVITTRCPIRINGKILYSRNTAPGLGEDTDVIKNEFSGMEKKVHETT
jgi:crotonobetainyl-CoA:carnitine CoA-transferase CaiB-like acyl-CoA transferase